MELKKISEYSFLITLDNQEMTLLADLEADKGWTLIDFLQITFLTVKRALEFTNWLKGKNGT